VSSYRNGGDNSSKAPLDAPPRKPLLNLWWVLLCFGVGIPAVVLLSRFASGGAAEIGGIMAASVVMNLRAFWNYHLKSWFLPLAALWAFANFALLFWVLIPMRVHESRAFINLIWVEFFSFAGLLWLATRAWGDLAE